MKGKALLVIGLALMLGASGSWAMDKGPHGQGGPGGMPAMADLTADQKAKIKAIGEAQKTEMAPLHEQAKAKLAELKALVDGKATDEAITAKLAELKTIRESVQAAHKKYMDQREQVLTPAQRAKMALKMGEMTGKGRDGKMGMKGGKGKKCAKEEGTGDKE